MPQQKKKNGAEEAGPGNGGNGWQGQGQKNDPVKLSPVPVFGIQPHRGKDGEELGQP